MRFGEVIRNNLISILPPFVTYQLIPFYHVSYIVYFSRYRPSNGIDSKNARRPAPSSKQTPGVIRASNFGHNKKQNLQNKNLNNKMNKNGPIGLDKTLSSFGLGNVNPQLLNPSLLHNGFILDREMAEAIEQHKKKKQTNNQQYKPVVHNLRERNRKIKNKVSLLPKSEFMTIRPTLPTVTPTVLKVNTRFAGSTPPTLPPPSGDIPPFVIQQRKYISKLQNDNGNNKILIEKVSGIHPRLPQKSLAKSRPPFPPPIQPGPYNFERTGLTNPDKGSGHEKANPILRLFKNVQKKSSTLTNLFSPTTWFQEKKHGVSHQHPGNPKLAQRNVHNFNRRMSPARTSSIKKPNPFLQLLKNVNSRQNDQDKSKAIYQDATKQHSRDEKSTRDSSNGFTQSMSSRDQQNKPDKGLMHNSNISPVDLDPTESLRLSQIKEISGIVGDSVLPAHEGKTIEMMETMESQLLPLPEELTAEKLAAMIEQLADEQLLATATNNEYISRAYKGPNIRDSLVDQAFGRNTMAVIPSPVKTEEPPHGGNTWKTIQSSSIEKRKTSYGLGFDPSGIQPESGFKPIVHGNVQSMPTLAFSVLDSLPDKVVDRQNKFSNSQGRDEVMPPHTRKVGTTLSLQRSSNRRMSTDVPQSIFLPPQSKVRILNY